MKLEMNSLKDENIRLKAILSLNNNNNESVDNRSFNDDCKKSPNRTLDKLISELKSNDISSDKHSEKLIKRIEECKSINHEIISQSFKDGDGKRVVISIYYGSSNKFDDILMVS
jgi:hypothetical protein